MIYEAKIFGEIPAKANHYQAVPDKRTGGRRIIKDRVIRNYEGWFVRQIKKEPGVPDEPIRNPFVIEVTICYTSTRHDLDNGMKTLLDCLQMAGIIRDDAQCREIHARKIVNKFEPFVHLIIKADEGNEIKFEEDSGVSTKPVKGVRGMKPRHLPSREKCSGLPADATKYVQSVRG